jgi:16S rRNA processing protein RimM
MRATTGERRAQTVPQIELIESADFFIEKEEHRGTMHAMHHHRTYELYFLVKGEREYLIPAVPGVFIESVDLDAAEMRVHLMKGLATDEN